MDATSVAIIGRLILCCLIVLIAAFTLHVGFKTYRVRSEVGQNTSDIRFGDFHLSSNSAGVFVMSLSAVWAVLLASVVPDYSVTEDSAQVVRNPKAVEFETAVLGSDVSDASGPLSSGALVSAFTVSATAAEQSDEGWVSLDGQKGSLASVWVENEGNTMLLNARVNASDDSAVLKYEGQWKDGQLRFVPKGVATGPEPKSHQPE